MPATARSHLLQLEGLTAPELTALLDRAEALWPVAQGEAPPLGVCAGRTVGNLFFEDSTRTRTSFTLAARRVGAMVVDVGEGGSSRSKGETILDTARTVEAMGVDALVVRAAESGVPHLLARELPRAVVVNAGDGRHEHPTQGLLDLLVLRRHLGDLTGRTVAIVGDVDRSRVARSALHGLTTLGADVRLVGPPTLVPDDFAAVLPESGGPGTVGIERDLDAILASIDAIMMLRVQFERGSRITTDYREHYGLTVARAQCLRDGAVVMHPGPMNRGLEIDSAVADGPRSVVLEQVAAGVAVRMAVLERALS